MSAILQTRASMSTRESDRTLKFFDYMPPLRKWQSWLCLVLAWLAVTFCGAVRIQEKGAFASDEAASFFRNCERKYHSNPGNLRLNQPYSWWAVQMPGTDARNYICGALGLFEGKGLAIKDITLQDLNSQKYVPYEYQSPGTPLAIWLIMRMFGNHAVFPYFCVIAIVHLFTASAVCLLARSYFDRELQVLGVGLLSLCCLPVLDSNFGCGLFWSEPLSAPWLLSALIVFAFFWKNLISRSLSNKVILSTAVCAGMCLAVASYFRDIYSSFAHFAFLTLVVVSIIKRLEVRKTVLFAITGLLVFSLAQLPWQLRNFRSFHEFSMSGASYCNAAAWWDTWMSYEESKKISWQKGAGLGDYLAPDKSAEIMSLLATNRREASKQAGTYLVDAILKKPWQAVWFKLSVYDMLWFGLPSCPYIYAACFLSTISFFLFLIRSRFRFSPDLWLIPLYLLCISPMIHYEHRYSQPFFLMITPITAVYTLALAASIIRSALRAKHPKLINQK